MLDIVILAAGRGTRMKSDLPKVLHPLAGRPLAEHVVRTAKALVPEHIFLVYGHGGDAVPRALADETLTFVLQAEQLGTGHAVRQAAPQLSPGGITLVLYGDVPLTRRETLEELLAVARTGALALLTVELADPTGYGRIVRKDGRVARIVEQKDAGAEELAIREINTGILALPTDRLTAWLDRLTDDNAQREYYLTDIVALAVNDGVPVITCHPAHTWEILGVNSRAQLAELERTHQGNQAAALMEAGVTLLDPVRFDVRGDLICGQDVIIDVNCVFSGRVELGDGVKVGANCVLQDVSVAAGAEILPFCHLEGARIGPNARVGPYARLRPGAVLEEDSHVGNFVEIKNARLGKGAKANHLSYVGDASVGAQVNIGAGTITCNYDGANKHRTVIGDNAFIGSNTALVAPVEVGAGATIGAGSVITKDAPAGELTLARAKQATIPGWQRPVKQKKES